jgi:hypothetical protein
LLAMNGRAASKPRRNAAAVNAGAGLVVIMVMTIR